MVRKKAAPQAARGPMEQRGLLGNKRSLGDIDSEDDDIDIEYQRATLHIRNAKRSKPRTTKSKDAPSNAITAVMSGTLDYVFGDIKCSPASDDILCVDLEGQQVTLSACDADGGVSIDFGDVQGIIMLSSPETATSLLELVKANWIELGTPSQYLPNSLLQIPIGLSHKAVEDGTDDADDERQRAWQMQLLDLVYELAPNAFEVVEQQSDNNNVASTSAAATTANPTNHGSTNDNSSNFNASELYNSIKPSKDYPELQGDFPQLKPTLRAYQRRAVQWMLDKELGRHDGPNNVLHPLWVEVACKDDAFYINPVTGRISTIRFVTPEMPRGAILADEMGLGKTVSLLTLILAHRYQPDDNSENDTIEDSEDSDIDTTERIECICGEYHDDNIEKKKEAAFGRWFQCTACNAWLHGYCIGCDHRAPPPPYICPPCQRSKASKVINTPCKTTLIVVPSPLLHQWYEEIHKHINPGTLKVVIYEGQQQQDAKSIVVAASDLAAADIVLCTYDALRKDLNKEPHGETYTMPRRRVKKYQVIPTPLTRLKFFRVVLDESQMIGSSTAQATCMAMLLATVHRWCVTGTPVSRGLSDLFGLVAFLKAAPYDDKYWWNQAIQQPCEANDSAGKARLIKLLKPSLGGLLWRTSKADVADELNLPPQLHHCVELDFTAIERHFYAKQHRGCVGVAQKALPAGVLAHSSTPNDGFENRVLTHKELDKLLNPLLRLRQACVHPQVGSNGMKHVSHVPMTMGQVLEKLVENAKVDAEDAQRALVAALNGLAGLYQLKEDLPTAASLYRQVMSLVEANKQYIDTDSLQRLHTFHNLAELLTVAQGNNGVARTLNDDTLQQRAQEIKDKYLAEPTARLSEADKDFLEAKKALEGVSEEFFAAHGKATAEQLLRGWFTTAIHMLTNHHPRGQDHVVQRIKDNLDELDQYRHKAYKNAASIGRRFRDLSGLQFVLTEDLNKLNQAIETVYTRLEQLTKSMENPTKTALHLAGTCWKCKEGSTGIPGNVCRHCDSEDLFLAAEIRLFSFKANAKATGDKVSIEQALKAIHFNNELNKVGRGGIGEAPKYASDPFNDPSMPSTSSAATTRSDVGGVHIQHEASQIEKAFRQLHHLLKTLRVPVELQEKKQMIVDAGQVHLDQLEAHRKMFLKARAVNTNQRLKLCSLEELDQCTIKMQLIRLGDSYGPENEIYKIHPDHVGIRLEELHNDRAVAEADLTKNLGTLKYLVNLRAKEGNGNGDNSNTNGQEGGASGEADQDMEETQEEDQCVICLSTLGSDVALFPCGHTLCTSCGCAVIDRVPRFPPEHQKVGCPTCRTKFLVPEVQFVSCQETVNYTGEQGESEIVVKGSYGAKIEAVVRRLLFISKNHPNEKVLVFSTWADALKLLSHALHANGLKHMYPKGKKQFDAAVAAFREEDKDFEPDIVLGKRKQEAAKKPKTAKPRKTARNKTATLDGDEQILLLETKQGANGLNLQQANHIVFVEPLLDPAEEAQAIGRVDRMGQTKSTHVHRFIISNTVEENVYKLGREREASMDMASATVVKKAPGAKAGSNLTVTDVLKLLQGGDDGYGFADVVDSDDED